MLQRRGSLPVSVVWLFSHSILSIDRHPKVAVSMTLSFVVKVCIIPKSIRFIIRHILLPRLLFLFTCFAHLLPPIVFATTIRICRLLAVAQQTKTERFTLIDLMEFVYATSQTKFDLKNVHLIKKKSAFIILLKSKTVPISLFANFRYFSRKSFQLFCHPFTRPLSPFMLIDPPSLNCFNKLQQTNKSNFCPAFASSFFLFFELVPFKNHNRLKLFLLVVAIFRITFAL